MTTYTEEQEGTINPSRHEECNISTRDVYLERYACGYLVTDLGDERYNYLVQSDWDFPGLAMGLGATNITCCRSTDGTVDCKEHDLTASEMIEKAATWLDDNEGIISLPEYSGIFVMMQLNLEKIDEGED